MIIMYILMVNMVLTINSMEEKPNNNAVCTYTLPFWKDRKGIPINVIDEIGSLASENPAGSLYRGDQEPAYNGQDKELGHLSKGKNDGNNNENTPDLTTFGTIPFKPSIDCTVGYPILINIILDLYFSYCQQLDRSTNKFRKVYQVNNMVNIYYIIAMLQKVSTTCIETSVNNLHEEYVNALLSKKGINMDTYTNKAEMSIHPKDTVHLINHMKDIDTLITYQNHHGLVAYSPLKSNAAECLLQLLLHIYIVWKQDEITHIISPLSDKMVLFLEAAQLNNALDNYEFMRKECDLFITQIQEAYENKDLHQKYQNKYLVLNAFLKALNKYVYNLTVVPVSSVKNSRNLSSAHSGLKRKKLIDQDGTDSFFTKHKRFAKNIALTILTLTLLYRLIKKNSKNVKT